ncbi:YncE family protein [Bradyrhizobium sp. CCGUVB1N3]|uniref:YncE family protein n=1 Tax=Bradyrhizobium sp. CCGUVB1N3 TaxID=2949629 RepID=UPI0020B2D9EB|nr:YncE family protein [Bradyrhizobium sp. CCGUVB1N3]MCP3471001.1 YncE family protein [Bradyrhizobium sp. CCGUVB1N3]
MSHWLRKLAVALAGIVLSGAATSARPEENSPLQLEAKILLGHVRGRIDHMAVDLKRQRLFVAELGNDSVGVVDLASRSVIHTISGLNEPQGVAYEPSTDMLFVANARDGSVKVFDGNDYKAKGQIELGSDADNIRIDAAAQRVIVGYGDGALAYLDVTTRNKVQNTPLKAHPESFQPDPDTNRIFVNLPNVRAVAVVDGKSGKQLTSWPVDRGGNYAMAIDRERNRLLVAFRSPPGLGVLELADGKSIGTADTCGDVDDLFVDARRKRVYVSCGQGYVDVLEANGVAYQRISRVPTVAGARTSLFIPEMDRLIVAVRESFAGPAAIWIFRPVA